MFTPPSDITSYKPFAQTNYVDEDNNKMCSLSAIDEEIIKTTALLQLQVKLSNVSPTVKSSLVYAQQVTDIVNDDHLLGFLYVENYDVDRALTRLLRYWNSRHKVFGDDYILPLTLYGAMKNNTHLLKKGALVLLPELDDGGRSIIYANPSLIGDEDPDKIIQLWWYLVHVAMERPNCRKNGFVVVSNAQDTKLRDFNPKLLLAIIKSGDSTFPVQRQATHVCNAHIFPLVSQAIKCMLSLRERQNVTVHTGPSERVLESLAACSLPPTAVPSCMGGLLDVSLEDLFKARLAIEAAQDNLLSEVNRSTNQDGNISDVSLASDSKPSSLSPMSSSSTNQTARFGFFGGISDVSMMTDQESDTSKLNSSKKSSASASASASSDSKRHTDQPSNTSIHSSKKSSASASVSSDSKPMSLPRKSSSKHAAKVKERGKIRKHPGRSGDERMHKAIDARRRNPDISLLDALLAGGFVFPNMYAPGIKSSEAKDIEGVSVTQRKNQLMRRIRLDNAKKKKK